jgi:hypothetical protein
MQKRSIMIAILMLSFSLILAGCQTAGTAAGTTKPTASSSTTNPSGSSPSGNVLNVKFIAVSKPDADKMVSIKISLVNLAPKAIQSVSFELEPYNAAGEIVKDERTGFSTQKCTVTSPIDVNQEVNDALWKDVWQNGDIVTVKLVGITVDFTDKDSVILTEEIIQQMNIPITSY